MARVGSLVRRSPNSRDDAGAVAFGNIEIRPEAREVLRDGQVVPLAPKEFDLLLALHHKQGAAVHRLDLIREVWGYPGDVLTRTVDTHMGELRRKLEADPNRPKYLLTVRKVGYRLKK